MPNRPFLIHSRWGRHNQFYLERGLRQPAASPERQNRPTSDDDDIDVEREEMPLPVSRLPL
jgi:hypothetical protein